jgi:hypothetical protein
MSVSNETDIFNVIVTKEFFERNRNVISNAKSISVEGPLQNEDGTIHVKASRVMPLPTGSHVGATVAKWTIKSLARHLSSPKVSYLPFARCAGT